MRSKEIKIIDCIKFIYAICIVGIHTEPFVNINNAVNFIFSNIIFRLAVPFFVVCSGYFIGRRSDYKKDMVLPNKQYFVAQVLKLIKLYALWSFIYLGISIINWIEIKWFSLFSFIDFGIACFTKGSYYHLWYLLSMIYALPIVYFILKIFNIKWIKVVTVILYAIQLLCYSYHFLLPEGLSFIKTIYDYISGPVDGLTRMVPFLLTGIIIVREKESRSDIRAFVCCFISLIIEVYTLISLKQSSVSYVFFTLPVAYYFFKVVLQLEKKIQIKSYKLFKSSTFIYCVHPLVIWILDKMVDIDNMWKFIIVVIICLITWGFIENFKKMISGVGRR